MAATTARAAPLESGDRLTRAEFHARYCAHPEIKKAELVEGVVYVASPTRLLHGEPHGAVTVWLGTFSAKTPGVRLAVEVTIFLGDDSEVQPDAVLFREPPAGSVRFTADGYLQGAPEFVVEVAASSASYDLHDKLRAYLRAGVQEYVVWRVLDGEIDWFGRRGAEFVRVEPDARGVIASAVFPGLRLDVAKMLAGDLAGVLAEMGRPQP